MSRRVSCFFVASILAGLSLLFGACDGTPPESVPEVQTPRQAPPVADPLANAVYPIEVSSTGEAALKNGVFEEPAAPGSAAMTRVALGEQRATGDLNGDGIEDTAVNLETTTGGSGSFTYLAAVLADDRGSVKPLTALFLGDRIAVTAIAIRDQRILVSALTREPGEPMASEPTVDVERTFKLDANTLVEVTEDPTSEK